MEGAPPRQATFGRNNSGSLALVLALWQPERPHNFGAALRLCACLGIELDLIEPAGFPLDDRRIRAGSLDYGPHARWQRHADAAAFFRTRRGEGRRLVLLSTVGPVPYHMAAYRTDDVLLAGSESAGVPDAIHAAVDLRVRVPMAAGRRSLNVIAAATLVLGEAMRQTGALDELGRPAEGP
jgi:tRNA (cytidine/uridine-2'-O-)-methyltransferase